jgi:hypothetical protein
MGILANPDGIPGNPHNNQRNKQKEETRMMHRNKPGCGRKDKRPESLVEVPSVF